MASPWTRRTATGSTWPPSGVACIDLTMAEGSGALPGFPVRKCGTSSFNQTDRGRFMRNFGLHLTLCVLLLVSVSSGQTVSRDEYLKGYDQRARYITAAYDTASSGYAAVASRYAHNFEIARADSMFIAELKSPRGDMFWMFPVIGAYMHGKDKMGPEAKAAVRNAWKTYAPYRGDTENHWAMYHASLFIAAEQWPNLPGTEWFNGKSSDENRRE